MKKKSRFLVYPLIVIGVLLVFTNGSKKNSSPVTPSSDSSGTSSAWTVLGNLYANNGVYTLCTDANNNVYAIGDFTDANNDYFIAKRDGSSFE